MNVTCRECISAYARYVYVLIPENQTFLMICELEVYARGNYHCGISQHMPGP